MTPPADLFARSAYGYTWWRTTDPRPFLLSRRVQTAGTQITVGTAIIQDRRLAGRIVVTAPTGKVL